METGWDRDDIDYIAEECAEDFYHNHDGWEHQWPKTFFIFDESENLLGTFEIHLEHQPTFRAYEK
jgi:hypothetical protein